MKNGTIERRDFYVYVLFSPLTGLPFYIGKGSGRRWREHEMRGERHRNPLIRAMLRSAGGREIPKVKIREGLFEAEAFEIEIAFISALGLRKSGGWLLNLTEGGAGSSGIVGPNRGKVLSSIHRERIRQALLGRKHTEESRAKMSKAVKAARARKPLSEESRERMKAAAKRRAPASQAARQKLREKAIAFASTEKGRLAKRAAALARWSGRRINRVDVD